jgi:hypothetical protein
MPPSPTISMPVIREKAEIAPASGWGGIEKL